MVRYEIYEESGTLLEWRDCGSATEARSRLLILGFLPVDTDKLTWSKGDAYTAIIVPIVD